MYLCGSLEGVWKERNRFVILRFVALDVALDAVAGRSRLGRLMCTVIIFPVG